MGVNSFCVVENLSIWNFVFQIGPFLIKKRVCCLYVVESSSFAFRISRFLGSLCRIRVEKFHFRSVEVKDEEGLLIRFRIPNIDLHFILEEILADPSFKLLYSLRNKDNHWTTFLIKSIGCFDSLEKQTFFKAMFLMQAARWFAKKSGHRCAEGQRKNIFVFLNQRPWKKFLSHYGEAQGVHVIFLSSNVIWDKQHFSFWYLKFLFFQLLLWRWIFQFRLLRQSLPRTAYPKLAVECYGYFNLDKLEHYSDFAFWQLSDLENKDLLALFHLPGDPLDTKKWEKLQEYGIQALALDPRATLVPNVVPQRYKFPRLNLRKTLLDVRALNLENSEAKWVQERIFYYKWLFDHWRNVFSTQNIKIYVTWFKYDTLHYPIAAAMKDVGGITAVYQRALDLTPFVETQIDVDVYFGYSKLIGDVERKVRSRIPYFIVTGYLGDHRFPLLKDQAKQVREKLLKAGAKTILSFTDEGSSDHSRWNTDHQFVRKDYAFILEKLLQNSWLGLVVKPKVPRTLRRRLGEVAPLLDEALKTGRCYLYEEGVPMGCYPPAVAALSADISIHSCVSALTAPFETALTGIPTLLLDREGWHVSPLYQLGVGKVVFNEWESLWDTCLGHWRSKDNNGKLGDWSNLLEQLDPFRDGQAFKRMGTFLHSLLNCFKKGMNREQALEVVVEQYAKKWGSDKIISINA